MDDPQNAPQDAQEAHGRMLALFEGQDRDDVADFITALHRMIALQERIEKHTRYLVDTSDIRAEAFAIALQSILNMLERQQQQLNELGDVLRRFVFDNS